MKKESVLTGAAILTAAGIVTRFIGFYYRIYMTKAIGSEGMGLYQLIMPLYLLAWTITSSGVTTTVSRLTSIYSSQGRYRDSLKILKSAVIITGLLSIGLEIIALVFAKYIAGYIIKDIRSILSIRIIALCLPFMSIGSSIRGFFFGYRNTFVPAISQVLEQLIRVGTVMFVLSIYSPKVLEEACGAAALGIALGELFSFLYTLVEFYKFNKGIKISKSKKSNIKNGFSLVLKSAIPLSAGRILGSLLATIENIMIPQRLALYGHSESNSLSIYGKLTGMAMPLIQFPTAILVSFSTALVPAISASIPIKHSLITQKTILRSLSFSFIGGIWALIVFGFYPREVSSILYNQASISTFVIKLAPICPILYTQITLSGILNGLGKQYMIFINNMISSLINIFFIYLLVPKIGIDAFILGLFISILVTALISTAIIVFETGIKINIINSIVKPIICGLASGIITKSIPFLSGSRLDKIIISLALITILYIAFLFVTGTISKKDIEAIIPRKLKKFFN